MLDQVITLNVYSFIICCAIREKADSRVSGKPLTRWSVYPYLHLRGVTANVLVLLHHAIHLSHRNLPSYRTRRPPRTPLSWMWSFFYWKYFLKHSLCPPLTDGHCYSDGNIAGSSAWCKHLSMWITRWSNKALLHAYRYYKDYRTNKCNEKDTPECLACQNNICI